LAATELQTQCLAELLGAIEQEKRVKKSGLSANGYGEQLFFDFGNKRSTP
jgi:hypothetical protein